MSADPPIELFLCPRYPGGLRLTPSACAGLWRRAINAPSWDGTSVCRGCEIGTKHANVGTSAGILGDKPCCRCGRTDLRLVEQFVCISCYNRSREAAIGRDRRGRRPRAPEPLSVLSVLGPAGIVSHAAACAAELALYSSRLYGGACGRVPMSISSVVVHVDDI